MFLYFVFLVEYEAFTGFVESAMDEPGAVHSLLIWITRVYRVSRYDKPTPCAMNESRLPGVSQPLNEAACALPEP